jgi:hypothetical protein
MTYPPGKVILKKSTRSHALRQGIGNQSTGERPHAPTFIMDTLFAHDAERGNELKNLPSLFPAASSFTAAG